MDVLFVDLKQGTLCRNIRKTGLNHLVSPVFRYSFPRSLHFPLVLTGQGKTAYVNADFAPDFPFIHFNPRWVAAATRVLTGAAIW